MQTIYNKKTLIHIVSILDFSNSAFSSSAVFNSLNLLLHDILNEPPPTIDNKEEGLKEKSQLLKLPCCTPCLISCLIISSIHDNAIV